MALPEGCGGGMEWLYLRGVGGRGGGMALPEGCRCR
jgi:hypothetical protein